MVKVYEQKYNQELSFSLNRRFQESGKEVAGYHKSIVEFIEEFPKSSAIQVHASTIGRGLAHINASWATMLMAGMVSTRNELCDVPDVETRYESDWLSFNNDTAKPGLFLTINTKTIGFIPLSFRRDSQGEEIQSWATKWVEKNEDLVWSYSFLTFHALMWVIENTTASIVSQSENKIHICGIYQGVKGGLYEQVDVIIDNEVALRTEEHFKER